MMIRDTGIRPYYEENYEAGSAEGIQPSIKMAGYEQQAEAEDSILGIINYHDAESYNEE